MQPIFITGIGTGVGKTLVAAIVTEALYGDYWKPVQAGSLPSTDSEWIRNVLGNESSFVYPEKYLLKMAASPHIAAREEGVKIDLDVIGDYLQFIRQDGVPKKKNTLDVGYLQSADRKHQSRERAAKNSGKYLVIEGAGGLMVPLNENEFVIDLIKKCQARVILVSRNYLGSINHSLLTAQTCRNNGLDVFGWIFNDQYLSYEEEIVNWSGYPKIMSIPFSENIGKEFVHQQAAALRPLLLQI